MLRKIAYLYKCILSIRKVGLDATNYFAPPSYRCIDTRQTAAALNPLEVPHIGMQGVVTGGDQGGVGLAGIDRVIPQLTFAAVYLRESRFRIKSDYRQLNDPLLHFEMD